MEQSGVIADNVAIVDPAAVGQPITIFVEVELESERTELIDAAKRQFSETPEVQQCYYVTGEADFILVLTVADMGAYEALTRKLFFGSNNVRKFRTFVAMNCLSGMPFLPDACRCIASTASRTAYVAPDMGCLLRSIVPSTSMASVIDYNPTAISWIKSRNALTLAGGRWRDGW